MSDLKSQLMKAREFDVHNDKPTPFAIECMTKWENYNEGYSRGHAKDQRLFELLIDVAVAAETERQAQIDWDIIHSESEPDDSWHGRLDQALIKIKFAQDSGDEALAALKSFVEGGK